MVKERNEAGTDNAAAGKKPKKVDPFRDIEGPFQRILPEK
jgi:hypothetical protein